MGVRLNRHLFREYDLRGVADRDLPDDVVFALGQAVGTALVREKGLEKGLTRVKGGRRIVVGKDARIHSARIHKAFVAGVLGTGVSVVDLGLSPSPLLYFAVHSLDVDGGVQITASHNPKEDNGFKVLFGKEHLCGERLLALLQLCETGDFEKGEGTLSAQGMEDSYLRFVKDRIRLGGRRFRVVLDGGNGAGGPLALRLLETLGFETVAIGCEPDGRFPLHPPDPTQPENLRALQEAVRVSDAEVGLALDGDADRLVVVDRKGRVISGDQLFLLLARAILKEEKGARFVCEVRCSRAVLEEIERAGGQPVVWRVGHTRIREKMAEVQAALGAEMSGHLFFAHRYLGFDDGIYAAARILEWLTQTEDPLSTFVDALPVICMTPEVRVDVPDSLKFEVVDEVASALGRLPDVALSRLDGVRATWKDAWALVRASHTQPSVCLRFEAESETRLQHVQTEVCGLLERIICCKQTERESSCKTDGCTGTTTVSEGHHGG